MEDSLKRHLKYQICTIIAALGACTGAFAGAAQAAGIGTILDVVNDGYRTPPGAEERDARPADEVVQDEMLRTADKSAISVKFVDGSELSVEALSEVVLSDYVYDGQASAGLINLNDGLFHFTSNGKNDQGVKLRTPIATIGIRGTGFDWSDRRNTGLAVMSGIVRLCDAKSGKCVNLSENCEVGQAGGSQAQEFSGAQAGELIVGNLPYVLDQRPLNRQFHLPTSKCKQAVAKFLNSGSGSNSLRNPPPQRCSECG